MEVQSFAPWGSGHSELGASPPEAETFLALDVQGMLSALWAGEV